MVNLHGPNIDKPIFSTEFQQIVSDLDNDNIIICGDLNLILYENLALEKYVTINILRARNVALNTIEESGYIDAFRV